MIGLDFFAFSMNSDRKRRTMDPKNIGYFSWNTMYCNVQSLIGCFLWEKEKHCSRWEQTQKGGDKAHELGSCPNFTSLQSWPPTTPRVIILMSKSKLGVFICACDCYSFQMIQVFHMAPFKTYIFCRSPATLRQNHWMKWKWKILHIFPWKLWKQKLENGC